MGWGMKDLKFVLPVIVLVLLMTRCWALQSPECIVPNQALMAPELVDNQDARDLRAKTESVLRRLQSEAAFMIDDYTIHAEKSESELKERATRQAKKIHEQAERDAQMLIKQAEEQTVKLKEETAKKIMLAEEKRAEEMLSAVYSAEQEALKIKFNERKKQLNKGVKNFSLGSDIPAFLSSRVPVTQEWRDNTFKKFEKDSCFIRKIILDGETPDEARDFINKFNEQAMWFDATLRGTQYIHDAFYEQIISKQSSINKLAVVQNKADDVIKRFAEKIALSDSEQQKLRLFVLYDLNSMVNKAMAQTNATDQLLPLDDTMVRGVVARVADEVLGSKLKERGFIAEFVMHDIEPVDRKIFDSLKKEMMEIKGILDEEIIKYNALKDQRKGIEQAGSKEALAIEMQLKESQALITHYKKQLKHAQNEQMNATIKCNDLIHQIEAKAKENLNFELALNDARHQIDQAMTSHQKHNIVDFGIYKSELEVSEKRALEIETDLKASQQAMSKLKDELSSTINEVTNQKNLIAKQHRMYRELSSRGQVLEELAEQRFNEHEQKMKNLFTLNDNKK